MKKTIRALLALECLVYVILFVKEFETIKLYELVTSTKQAPEAWMWLYFSGGLSVASLLLAAVYAFSRYLWKKRWLLAVSVGLYAVFLAFSDALHADVSYTTLPAAVTLLATGGYIACIYAVKLPHRRYIAGGIMAVLAISLVVVYAVAGGPDALAAWALRYTAPLIPFGLLGLILPERYD